MAFARKHMNSLVTLVASAAISCTLIYTII